MSPPTALDEITPPTTGVACGRGQVLRHGRRGDGKLKTGGNGKAHEFLL
ncbi:MAG TPA: hypothetical protein VJQ06_06305 [Rhizomicrobium sp.]|nr:hypothetical protein [Rhizomicrobium sp.]